VRQLRKQLRGLKGAQAIPGQTAADLANRAYQSISSIKYELEERLGVRFFLLAVFGVFFR
jgi:hypothetical protein